MPRFIAVLKDAVFGELREQHFLLRQRFAGSLPRFAAGAVVVAAAATRPGHSVLPSFGARAGCVPRGRVRNAPGPCQRVCWDDEPRSRGLRFGLDPARVRRYLRARSRTLDIALDVLKKEVYFPGMTSFGDAIVASSSERLEGVTPTRGDDRSEGGAVGIPRPTRSRRTEPQVAKSLGGCETRTGTCRADNVQRNELAWPALPFGIGNRGEPAVFNVHTGANGSASNATS